MCCMKPRDEKPVAMSLGEAVKGSGQCNAGSGVSPSTPGSCSPGAGVNAAGCANGASGGSGKCYSGSYVYIG